MSLTEALASKPLPLSPPQQAPNESNKPPDISCKDLLQAVTGPDAFDRLYMALTNRIIESYQVSGRKRSALKLHASIAALEQ